MIQDKQEIKETSTTTSIEYGEPCVLTSQYCQAFIQNEHTYFHCLWYRFPVTTLELHISRRVVPCDNEGKDKISDEVLTYIKKYMKDNRNPLPDYEKYIVKWD